MPEVNPRTEADAQIARSLQIVVDAGPEDPDKVWGGVARPIRDYTLDELETLFFALGMAVVQLKKLPGGQEAYDRGVHNMRSELRRRGRSDLLDKLDAEAAAPSQPER